jgi:hypothetical protein
LGDCFGAVELDFDSESFEDEDDDEPIDSNEDDNWPCLVDVGLFTEEEVPGFVPFPFLDFDFLAASLCSKWKGFPAGCLSGSTSMM